MTNSRRAAVATLLLFQAGWLLGPGVAAQAAEGKVKFTAEPANSSAVDTGYFRLKANPGATVARAISVRNISNSPIDLKLAAVAARTGQKGGVDYGLPTEDPGIGDWVELSAKRVTLQPGESRRVPFTVSIPDSTSGGVNLAGVAVWIPANGPGSQSGSQKGNAFVTVQTRRVIAVQIDVPGGAGAQIVVDGVKSVALPDGPYLEMAFTNTGSTLTVGGGTVTVADLGFEQDFTFDTFVPRTPMHYPVTLGEMPKDGSYETSIHLDFEGGSLDWSGEMVIGEALTSELVDRGALEKRSSLPKTLALVGGLLLIVGAAVIVLRRHRRRAASISIPSKSAPMTPDRRPMAPRLGRLVSLAAPPPPPPSSMRIPRAVPPRPPPPPPSMRIPVGPPSPRVTPVPGADLPPLPGRLLTRHRTVFPVLSIQAGDGNGSGVVGWE